MDSYRRHEMFEMQVLNHLNSGRILSDLVFGGGTMLRLCHGLDRYSVDLDFYLREKITGGQIEEKMMPILNAVYDITDHKMKANTLILEIRSPRYPRRLKIEINIRRNIGVSEPEIAWSPFSDLQVLTETVPLDIMMEMKCEALINRREIRDAYDIEFLIRKGISLTEDSEKRHRIKDIILNFTSRDFKVKLGSILEPDKRDFYIQKGFRLLLDQIWE